MLDEDEQENLIIDLERAASRQTHYTKQLFSALGIAMTVLHISFGIYQAMAPDSHRLQQHVMLANSGLKPSAIILGEVGSALVSAVGTLAVITFGSRDESFWRWYLQLGLTFAMIDSCFWTVALYKVLQHADYHWTMCWRVLWLPLAPLLFIGACVHVIDDLAKLKPQFTQLRDLQYQYKKL